MNIVVAKKMCCKLVGRFRWR